MTTTTRVAPDDVRVTSAFLTPREVALLTNISPSRAYEWARRELVTTVEPYRRGWPTVPLLGLVEYETFMGMRSGSMTMEEVLGVADFIRKETDPFGFLNRNLVHDGTVAYFEQQGQAERVLNGQYAIWEVVQDYLRPLVWGEDGWAIRFRVERIDGVVIDPEFNAGRMMFERNAVPVFAPAGLLKAGEAPEVVADEYGLTHAEVAAVAAELPWVSQVA